MSLGDYHYALPPDRIAQQPVEPRDAARMLVVGRDGAVPRVDARVADLADRLDPGDLLVVNDTRVLPARLLGRKTTGGRVEVLLLHPEGTGRWEALVRTSKRAQPGTVVRLDGSTSVVVEEARGEGRFGVRVDTPGDPLEAVEALGRMPLPPYIRRENPDLRDRTWYQTVFARRDRTGSAAAPTAGLHFTADVLASLDDRGVQRVPVTLHVGLGTFLPVRTERLDDHRMHREWYDVPPHTAATVNRALDEGRRVVAVGTTATRVLEHAGRTGRLDAGSGWTDLFLRPGHRWQVVGGLLTNFHLPESTLLVLVCAFGGRDNVLDAYRHAVEVGYRFYSYGDAMLLL